MNDLWRTHVEHLVAACSEAKMLGTGDGVIPQFADDYLTWTPPKSKDLRMASASQRFTHMVSFEDAQNAANVENLMEDGYSFTEACIRLKLKPLVHYTITRAVNV